MINAGSVVAFMELDTSKFSTGLSLASEQLKGAARNFKDAFSGPGVDMSERFNNVGLGMKNLGSSITSVGSSITKNISLPLAAAGGACAKLASDFETGMAKIKTIADTSKVSMQQLGDSVKQISMDTGQATGDVQDAMYDALSSGVATDKVGDFVNTASKAAIGGFTTTQVAVDGLTTTLNAYGKSADQANKLSNEMMITQNLGKTTFGELSSSIGNIAATSAAAGMSTEELFSSLGVLTANGIKTSEAVTGLKAALSNIVKPSSEATKAADALGLKFNVAEMKTKGWMPFLDEVRQKLEASAPAYAAATDKVNDLEQKIKDAQEGKTANAEKYKAEIDAQTKAISDLEKQKKGASNSAEKKRLEDEIQLHKDKIKTLKEEEAQAKKGYSPQQVADWKKQLADAKKEQKALEGASQDKLMGFATMFGSVEGLNSVLALTSKSGQDLYKTSMQQMNSGKDYLSDAYNTMMDTPEQKMKKAVASLKVAGIELGGAFLPYISQAADAIVKVVKAFEALPAPVKNAVGQFMAFGALLGPAIMLGGKVVSSIGSIFIMMGKAPQAVSIFTTAFSKIPGIFRALGTGFLKIGPAFGKVFSGLIGVGGKVLQFFVGFGSKLVGVFRGLAAAIGIEVGPLILIILGIGLVVYEIFKHWDKVGPFFEGVGKKIKSVFSDVTDYLHKSFEGWKIAFGKVSDYISKSLQGWSIFGEQLIDGLMSGLKKGKDKVMNFFGDLGDSIKDKFKTVMGIHSPSRVFMEFGQFIGQGLLGGMASMEKSLSQQAQKYGQIITPNPSSVKIPQMGLGGINSRSMMSRLRESVLNFNPVIHLYVTVQDTGEKGTKKLTDELKVMATTSLKDGLVSIFLDDAIRD